MGNILSLIPSNNIGPSNPIHTCEESERREDEGCDEEFVFIECCPDRALRLHMPISADSLVIMARARTFCNFLLSTSLLSGTWPFPPVLATFRLRSSWSELATPEALAAWGLAMTARNRGSRRAGSVVDGRRYQELPRGRNQEDRRAYRGFNEKSKLKWMAVEK
jgi:hypothetical protein